MNQSGSYADPGVMVSRIGTIRRLQALHAIGFGESELGRHLAVSKQAVRNLRTHPSPVMLATTAARVAALYDRLWDQAPTSVYASRTTRWAAQQRWLPPLAWDDDTIDNAAAAPAHADPVVSKLDSLDDIAVTEAIQGRQVHLTTAERSVALRALIAAGYTQGQIRDRLGVTVRTVQRKRTAA